MKKRRRKRRYLIARRQKDALWTLMIPEDRYSAGDMKDKTGYLWFWRRSVKNWTLEYLDGTRYKKRCDAERVAFGIVTRNKEMLHELHVLSEAEVVEVIQGKRGLDRKVREMMKEVVGEAAEVGMAILQAGIIVTKKLP